MALYEPHSCPDPETLGAFLDGTLDAESRNEVSTHLAGCNHCLYVLREASASEPEILPLPRRSRWHLPLVAGLLIAILTAAIVAIRHRGDPVRRMAAAAQAAGVRTFEGRLAGFDYARYTSTRSMTESHPLVRAAANDVLQEEAPPQSAEEWHARGVANLLVDRMDRAVRDFAEAVRLAPQSARYRNDLATGRIALGTARLDPEELRRGLAEAEEALRLAPRLRAARFNRALALERLGDRTAARAAFEAYLAVDSDSPWAEEVRWRLNRLSR